ncbi:MAG: serine hydrolase domain-containing protein, partial [Aggregatilineales bacterium]
MSQEKFEKVVQIVKEMMEEHHVPGIALGIIDGDQTYTTGLGVTSVDNPLDVTDETLFQIGSITKTYTTTAIMCLVEQGKLDLNARVRQYLPNFKVLDDSVADKVTVKHLVTHSAGWVGDVFTDTGSNDDSMKLYMEQMAELDQLAPPDTVFSYNNAAFAVAGHLIEIVTGKPYEAAIQELIFEPLGLERSFFFPRDMMTFRFVVGHVVIDDVAKVQRPWSIPRSSNAAGGITCHVKDLLSYARLHMEDGTTKDGTRLLSSETVQLMQTPQFPINDFDGDIGLSWWIKERNGVKLVGHGGTTIGQTCDMVFAPSKRFAIAILANGNQGSLPVHAGFKVALKEYLGIEEPESLPAPAS